MTSSYRYIWMLLILALPVVATSVVLGGATWMDVFGCFVLLSFHAMIFTSLALLISSVTNKPASAVIWSLLAVGGYVIVATMLYGFGLSSSFASMHGNTSHQPFVVAINPFLPLQAINSTTLIGSTEVPNWIFGAAIALLLTRLFLLGAAVNLAPLDRRLSANLRVTGLVYSCGLSLLVIYSLSGMFRSPGVFGANGLHSDMFISIVALGCVAWLILVAPIFSCYSGDGSRRFKFNGRFNFRHVLDGTPAGNLPYLLSLVAASYVGVIVGAKLTGAITFGPLFAQSLLWPIGFYVLMWSIGQLMSSVTSTLRTARTISFVIVLLPPLLFPIVMGVMRMVPPWVDSTFNPSSSDLWYLWPFAPFTAYDLFHVAWIYGVVMLAAGLAIAHWARGIEDRRSLRDTYA